MAPPFPLDNAALDQLVNAALAEDIGPGDATSAAVIDEEARLSAVMATRQPMVLAGLGVAEATFRALDPSVTVLLTAADGDRLDPGARLMTIEGPARALLTAERTALNFVQMLSGIATLARIYADAIDGTGTILLDTRKTIPGLRALSKYASACGGAQNHRMGLYDAVLIKDNHLALAGSIAETVQRARAAGNQFVEVECDTLDQVGQALDAGADRILLDNMTLEDLRRAVAMADGRVPLEASGGVTLETIRDIAETGVTHVSVGRITQSAPACDIGLDYLGPTGEAS